MHSTCRQGPRVREEPLDSVEVPLPRLPHDRDRPAHGRESRLFELAEVLHRRNRTGPQADGDDHERAEGVVSGTSARFEFKSKDVARVACRLDDRKWRVCSAGWAMYENLAPGPHTFTARAYSIHDRSFVDYKRSFIVSAPPPG